MGHEKFLDAHAMEQCCIACTRIKGLVTPLLYNSLLQPSSNIVDRIMCMNIVQLYHKCSVGRVNLVKVRLIAL